MRKAYIYCTSKCLVFTSESNIKETRQHVNTTGEKESYRKLKTHVVKYCNSPHWVAVLYYTYDLMKSA